jgi:putative intracellular protease/amidase/YHS domain-containing protein
MFARTTLLFTLLTGLSIAFTGNAAEPKIASPVLKGLDPVHLVRGKELAGDSRFSFKHNGLLYYFADAKSQAQFQEQPEKYAIQGDGKCALAPNYNGNPDVFAVHEGKIYIFYCTHCREAFVSTPAKYLTARKTVAILVHDGVELLDFAGPGEVFAATDLGRAYKVLLVAADAKPITSQGFVTITPNCTFADCPQPDVIVLPGGTTVEALKDPRLVAWLKQAEPKAEVVLSVCTGAFILGEAGLLEGKEATTHWGSIEALTKKYPKTKVHADRRYVDNGKIVTAAGVSAGIDASLHIVERLLGKEVAQTTARYMQYQRRPTEE